MKQSKILSKKNLVLTMMILALGAAIWLNMKYSSGNITANTSSSNKYLGEALYVDSVSANSVETSASVSSDSFSQAVSDRDKARKESIQLLKETIDNAKLSTTEKAAAVSELASISAQQEKEAAIETLLKAKGFKKAAVVIGGDNVSVIVKNDHELLDSETMQITDAVLSQIQVKLENIKIVTIK